MLLFAAASISVIWACQPDWGASLVTPGPLPSDALLVIEGWNVDTIEVRDENASLVDPEVETTEVDGDSPSSGAVRYGLRPAGGWAPGHSYSVGATYGDLGGLHSLEWTVDILPASVASAPVVGVPDLVQTGRHRVSADSMCDYDDAVYYTLTLNPAMAAEDGLGWLELERDDGYLRVFDVPTDGAPFEVEIRAEHTGADCFVLRQVDAAGNASEASAPACAPAPRSPRCGCAAAPDGPLAASAMLSGLFWARLRGRARPGSGGT